MRKKYKWNGLYGAKIVSSSRSLFNPFISSQRLSKFLCSLELERISSETSLQQYGTMTFLTWNANAKYIGTIDLIKPSPVRILLALFHFADEFCGASDFYRRSFSVLIVATFLSISSIRIDMAFSAAYFADINFLISSLYILLQFSSSIMR